MLGHFPCRVKVMVEGEEEIGSPNVESFIQEHPRTDTHLTYMIDIALTTEFALATGGAR